MSRSREGWGSGPLPIPPRKSKVALGSLRTSGTDRPQEAIGPFGSNCFSREVCTALMNKKNRCIDPP